MSHSVLIVVLVLAALAVGVYLWRRRTRVRAVRPAPEEWEVAAAGVVLKGIRYRNPGFSPVVLVHGYAGNTRNWRDLGYALHENGFDVWMPNLRGHGKGSHRSVAHGKDATHSFDSMVSEDFPVLVDYVVQATGRRVAIVAHSMGGIAARAYLAGVGRSAGGELVLDAERAKRIAKDKVSCLVLMGSPPHFHNCSPAIRFLLKQPKPLVEFFHQGMPVPDSDRAPTAPDETKAFGRLRQGVFSKLVGGLTANSVIRGIVHVTNFNSATAELPRLLTKGVSKVHLDLIRDMQRWVGKGDIHSRNGFDFGQARAISVPILFVAGEYDGLAPWKDVFESAEQHGVHTSTWQLLVRRTSHVDLIAGERAAKLLTPWLKRFVTQPASIGAPGSRIEV